MSELLVESPGPFVDVLEVEDDETLVLSVLLDRDSQGRIELRHGSAIFAPEGCGRVGWGVWRTDQTREVMSLCPGSAPASFVHDGGDWLAGRAVLPLDEARRWLANLPSVADAGSDGERTLPPVAGLPGFLASLESPRSVLRVFPGTDTPASNFLRSAVRPALGTIWAAHERPGPVIPFLLEHRGSRYGPVTTCLLGINVATDAVPQAVPPPFGLFVGRLERKAWLCNLGGDGPAFSALKVHVGWDPDRVDLLDLILDLEQFLGPDLVNQMRIPIEDTTVSDGVREAGMCETSIPTLGRGLSHQVTLSTREGAVLDRIGPHHLIEQIHIALEIDGHPAPPIKVGSDAPLPGLEERSNRARRIAEQLDELATRGAEARLLVDREVARQRMRADLLQARDELLVHDRFFGQDVDDWRLLDDVPVPVRVVTAKISDELPEIAQHVEARYRPKAPMHDRYYIWHGGGLWIGGSPTTFGQAPVRVSRLTSADSDLLKATFEGLWASDLFREVPRKAESP